MILIYNSHLLYNTIKVVNHGNFITISGKSVKIFSILKFNCAENVGSFHHLSELINILAVASFKDRNISTSL